MLDVLSHDLRTPRRLSLRGRKWKYRGEGNANLVLALIQERKIVRLRKNENGLHTNVGEEEERERVVRETVFCRCVMVPLLGNVYIQPPAAAYMEEEEVERLDQMLRSQRPAYRHHKGLRFSHVTVYPDYALLPLHLNVLDIRCTIPAPTFCVEVKPKQGWIPRPDRRLSKCTFCLNQYLKMKNGAIQSKSDYCPLDLFSGIHSRMKSALCNLLVSPQNNLKIFQDGVLVYGDEVGESLETVLQKWLGTGDFQHLQEKFVDLVFKALTSNLCPDIESSCSFWDENEAEKLPHQQYHATNDRISTSLIQSVSQVLPDPPCDWSAEYLPKDCILERILRIQKLEQSGADTVYHIYRSGGYDITGSDYSYVGGLLNKNNPMLTPVHRYLLAATAKDCSVMMAFQQCDIPMHTLTRQVSQTHILKDQDAQSYVFNIGVSDLDPKPLSCIEKHRKRDCEVVAACLELLGGAKELGFNVET